MTTEGVSELELELGVGEYVMTDNALIVIIQKMTRSSRDNNKIHHLPNLTLEGPKDAWNRGDEMLSGRSCLTETQG